MFAAIWFLLVGFASVAALHRRHSSSSTHHHHHHTSNNIVAVHVQRHLSCAQTIGAALTAAGCHPVLRTDVQTDLASMCSYELTTSSCDHRSALAGADGFIQSYKTSIIKRPKPVDVAPPASNKASAATATEGFNPNEEIIHNITGVLDARYKLGLTGKGIKVAIIDTGVYYLHPALGGGFGKGFKVAFGYDLVGDNYNGTSATIRADKDPIDNCSEMSHGTHVAGIVAANATNITKYGFVPDNPFTGVAPGVTLGAYRVFGCKGGVNTDIVAEAILRAAQDGADIINLSLGSLGNTSDIVAVTAEIASKAGHIVVAAIGNDGDAGAYAAAVPAASLGALAIASFQNEAIFDFFEPGGTVNSFSSPGLTDDLFLKPDIGGIGGDVYSTISPFAATNNSLSSAYAWYSGTSFASPYVAGCIALLLQKRGKVGFDKARAYLQNTATVTNKTQDYVEIFDKPLVHSPAYQGAGLINIYKAATTGTLITPSSLSLNDTANRKLVENIQIKNNYNVCVTYKLSHIPAATANTFNSGDDMVLGSRDSLNDGTTFTTNNTATVKFGNSTNLTVTIKAGQAVTIPVQIIAPVPAKSDIWPLYGGYITISNSFDKIVSQIPYAGVAGVWKKRHIWARNSTLLYNNWGVHDGTGPESLFGVKPASVGTGLYADNKFKPLAKLQVVNATKYGLVLAPAASASRSANITITFMCKNDTSLSSIGLNRTNFVALLDLSYYFTTGKKPVYFSQSGYMPRVAYTDTQSHSPPHVFGFDGKVYTNSFLNTTVTLPGGVYQMSFSARKNFGSDKDLDVITTPSFQLVYNTPLSKQFLASCQI